MSKYLHTHDILSLPPGQEQDDDNPFQPPLGNRRDQCKQYLLLHVLKLNEIFITEYLIS